VPTLRRLALVGIALFATLAALAIAYRKPIAQSLLVRELRGLGLDQATLAVRRLDPEQLEVDQLSTGMGDGLEVARIEARFSLGGLFASRLDALKISGLRLRGTLDDGELTFGDLDRLLEGRTGQTSVRGPIALPTSGVEIEDALLEIATPHGPLRASLEARAVEVAPGRLDASAVLQADCEWAKLNARLRAQGSPAALAGELVVRANSSKKIGSEISADSVSLKAETAFSFDAGSVAIRPDGCADIHIEGLSMQPRFALAKPLDLCLRSPSELGFRVSTGGAIESDLELAPIEFAGQLRVADELRRVTVALSELRVRASGRAGAYEASLETKTGRVDTAEESVELRDIALDTDVSPGAVFPMLKLRVGEMFEARRDARFPHLTLDARAEPNDGGVAFAMELANPNRELVIGIKGAHALDDRAGEAYLHLHAIEFEPGRLQPSMLFPALSRSLREATGAIEVKGSVGWNADRSWGRAELAVRDFGATTSFADFEHVNSIVEVNESGVTPPDQVLSIGRIDFGLELTDGLIRFQLKRGGVVAIESASWKLAGGELTTAGEIDLQADERELTLAARGLDLTKLFELVNLKGLDGSGRLEGELPIALVGNDLEIRNAVLRSTDEGGVIRFHSKPGVANIAAADDRFATTLEVLENFHYEKLALQIDGPATGEVAIKIHLVGSNPDYRNGHPIDFNLAVDSRLSDLLRTGIRIYRIPEEIEKRLAAFAERER